MDTHSLAEAMQSTMTTPGDELIDIEEKDIYASIRKKRNWSSRGNDKKRITGTQRAC